jgi:hypothetical protein
MWNETCLHGYMHTLSSMASYAYVNVPLKLCKVCSRMFPSCSNTPYLMTIGQVPYIQRHVRMHDLAWVHYSEDSIATLNRLHEDLAAAFGKRRRRGDIGTPLTRIHYPSRPQYPYASAVSALAKILMCAADST